MHLYPSLGRRILLASLGLITSFMPSPATTTEDPLPARKRKFKGPTARFGEGIYNPQLDPRSNRHAKGGRARRR